MKLKALDTLHLSELGPMPLLAGQAFEVSDLVGEELVERGLAEQADDDAPASSPKKKGKKGADDNADPASGPTPLAETAEPEPKK